MNEKISKILNHRLTIPIVIGVVSFGSGLGAGYILGRKNSPDLFVEVHEVPDQMELDFNATDLAELEGQSSDSKLPSGKLSKDEVAVRLGEDFVGEVFKKVEDEEVVPEPEPEVQNIFAGDTPEWDHAHEVSLRSEHTPYIIHKDEFYAEESGYPQFTLSYYAGDNILASEEDDSPIYNHSSIVGELIFGHGSGDENVVYVRNDKLRAEYEIFRNEGLFTVEVMGLDIEDNARVKDLKHSSNRKFRDVD